ncbi:tetratricopeptide repeat protein [Flagellimonas algicola]|uniref:Tetratricopeptide repeat protein n=1 Tax=Flagellimonas algicola TaxID=2583815 RepID=A0ABY2WP07_9FLAO|nr:tetratricopeptide repeat protein [Allomuricauda algicola]TMU56259.1 tetratricopeptide repeat protein [Allomuricauda algicola]
MPNNIRTILDKLKIFNLFFLVNISVLLGQNSQENMLYVVDSVPIIEEPKEGFGTLTQEQIDRVETLKDKQHIANLGYPNLDGIIYVFTKKYAQRPDSIKTIPTTNLMIKTNGVWYFKDSQEPYSGRFIDYYLDGSKQGEGTLFNGRLKGKRLMYHLNGNISDEIEYEHGISNGLEQHFSEDGTLIQKGIMKNGKKIGVWEMYHPNGQLKQQSTFDENGNMDGTSVSYYSTGELKGKVTYKNGVYQKNKDTDKVYEAYKQGQNYYKQGEFKYAIKKYSKCIEVKPNWVDGYFARGTAFLNNLEFDKAILDFNKVLEIEPHFTNAYANRAFALIRKYEFQDNRALMKTKEVTVMTSKSAEIPESDLNKICKDIEKAISLGDNNWMVIEALGKYCPE